MQYFDHLLLSEQYLLYCGLSGDALPTTSWETLICWFRKITRSRTPCEYDVQSENNVIVQYSVTLSQRSEIVQSGKFMSDNKLY